MLIDKKTKQVMLGNVEIKRIMSEGGVLWEKKSLGPGPTKLIGGNEEAGFYGEVSSKDFINGDELANRIGLTAGKSQYSNEPWLKFSYMGKIEFVAKKPFRSYISWDDINNVKAVFGNRTVKIGEHTYKIRLMKGKTEGKQSDSSSSSGSINHGSEWNKLMLPIHKKTPSNWGINYSDADLLTLLLVNDNAYGAYSWCQEYGSSTNVRLNRGGDGVSSADSDNPESSGMGFGWRPVLELVD